MSTSGDRPRVQVFKTVQVVQVEDSTVTKLTEHCDRCVFGQGPSCLNVHGCFGHELWIKESELPIFKLLGIQSVDPKIP